MGEEGRAASHGLGAYSWFTPVLSKCIPSRLGLIPLCASPHQPRLRIVGGGDYSAVLWFGRRNKIAHSKDSCRGFVKGTFPCVLQRGK
ncbi:hypothetical protein E2C01_068367 [Portunus trituberculatus]|uniref:Uncharacterized protein n=1 Tax=Portunus trituberculatus TaxID=210409 RepID=A0A5B7HRS6_PORTR|nr:hypothetical protein [Portunus trituberculatus]